MKWFLVSYWTPTGGQNIQVVQCESRETAIQAVRKATANPMAVASLFKKGKITNLVGATRCIELTRDQVCQYYGLSPGLPHVELGESELETSNS